jgi:flagellin
VTLSKTFATTGTLVGSTTFSLNGQTFTTSASTTVQDVLNQINSVSDKTGVTATYSTGAGITLTTTSYGSNEKINFADSSGVLNAGAASAAGTDAVATVKINGTTVTFTGGIGGADGLTLSDGTGNTLRLTEAGNSTTVTNANIGQVTTGLSQFQIGCNVGQTTNLSLPNMQASALGGGAVSGYNMSNIDISTASGAAIAMQVIDAAITQVSQARGNIGAFEADVLNPNMSALSAAQQNLSSSLSSITDTNVAQEMTNYTKLQILQQAGMSVLAQANQAPQGVLKLLQ